VAKTVGVFKAYTTRVGYGPFPTELVDSLGERIREVGSEFGTTTGRARRVGWFDAAMARYAIATNGIDSMVMTKVDVLDEVDPIKICTGYAHKGEVWDHPMANISHLKHAQPVYEELPASPDFIKKSTLRGLRQASPEFRCGRSRAVLGRKSVATTLCGIDMAMTFG